MKYAFAFAGLVAGALAGECYAPPPATSTYAAPKPTSSSAADSGYFGIIAARSASPIHLRAVEARDGHFYIGAGGPTTYCPAESIGAANCPPGNTTVLSGGDNTLSLGVVVPGGQEVYVAPDGALSYTTAHSVRKPDGSIVEGFSKTAAANGESFGYLNFDTGFVACPASTGYQVYGQTQDFKAKSDCLGFSAIICKLIPLLLCL
jgi:hypothetical protein